MGCCCSCLEGEEGASTSETEMKPVGGSNSSQLIVSRAMSAPSIDVSGGNTISGYGLALIGATMEQDAAYWEAHVEIQNDGPPLDVSFGVATKKNQKFYEVVHDHDEDAPANSGLNLMSAIKVKNGDTVGIAAQQSDLPMIQFLLNGEPLHDKSINRFRGSVYPSVYLPENDGVSVKMVFNESEFRQESPNVRFGPFIVARGLI